MKVKETTADTTRIIHTFQHHH